MATTEEEKTQQASKHTRLSMYRRAASLCKLCLPLRQEIIDDVVVFFVLVAGMAGGDDVALGRTATAAQGNDMIHRHLCG